MLDRIFLSNSYSYRKKKCAAVIVFIAIYLLIPTIVTLNVTGVVYTPVNEDYSDGRKVIVKYRNATQEVGVDRFVAMVLAKRLYMSSEVEVLKAESIMIRTDVYRLMGEQMIIDSSELGMEYMSKKDVEEMIQQAAVAGAQVASDTMLVAQRRAEKDPGFADGPSGGSGCRFYQGGRGLL